MSLTIETLVWTMGWIAVVTGPAWWRDRDSIDNQRNPGMNTLLRST